MMRTKFDGLIRSMTTSVFASLPTAWPEYLTGFGGRGTLLAQVHQNSWRRLSDGTIESDVIARALVFMPQDEISPDHLARLTIRYVNTELNYDYLKMFPEMQNHAAERAYGYQMCAEQIKALPVIDFWELAKTWPVVG